MAKLVTLIGAVDRKPEELLRAAGMHVSLVAESALGIMLAHEYDAAMEERSLQLPVVEQQLALQ